ncbi:hypothetical protein WN51_12867 [Melipona quadrifasciata]|uniref:Uncharacterized protein n=1 Tax=Melipona quadrifasciata TaxID=166423 RepID=A0A0M9A1R2_9HYME|nr:hypothetical protein WN51_12867 [Melipona quadrifasciata]
MLFVQLTRDPLAVRNLLGIGPLLVENPGHRCSFAVPVFRLVRVFPTGRRAPGTLLISDTRLDASGFLLTVLSYIPLLSTSLIVVVMPDSQFQGLNKLVFLTSLVASSSVLFLTCRRENTVRMYRLMFRLGLGLGSCDLGLIEKQFSVY